MNEKRARDTLTTWQLHELRPQVILRLRRYQHHCAVTGRPVLGSDIKSARARCTHTRTSYEHALVTALDTETAMHALAPEHRHTLVRRYIFGDPVRRSSERRRVADALDELAHVLTTLRILTPPQ